MSILENADTGAVFSSDRSFRYILWRIWDREKPLLLFIGLNPSQADEQDDDPTIRRVRGFAKDLGFGGVYVMNLFAYCTPYPQDLLKVKDPLGENDKWLEETAAQCEKILFGWGSFKEARDRGAEIARRFQGYALVINKDGTPGHPLYVRKDTKLQLYNMPM